MEDLRTCCGVKPEIVIENFRNTKYKMRRIQCPVCGNKTGAKRFLRMQFGNGTIRKTYIRIK